MNLGLARNVGLASGTAPDHHSKTQKRWWEGSSSEAPCTWRKCKTESWSVLNSEFWSCNPMATSHFPDFRGRPMSRCHRFKKKASQTVRTHVRLVVEEDSCFVIKHPNGFPETKNLTIDAFSFLLLWWLQDNMSNMTKAFQGTAFVDWKAEVCQTTSLVSNLFATTSLVGCEIKKNCNATPSLSSHHLIFGHVERGRWISEILRNQITKMVAIYFEPCHPFSRDKAR